MDEEMNATEYLLKAILEIIDKSKSVEEIREAVKKSSAMRNKNE